MPASIFGNPAAVVQLNQALFGIAPGNGKYTNQLDQANAIGAIPFARQLGQTVAASNESLAATVLANVGIVNATLQTALVQAFAAFPNDRGVVVLNLTNILTTLEGNAVYGAAAAQFNAQVATDFQYSTNPVNTADSPINAGTATLTANTDILTGNLFTAGLVFTPGGDDRINSLQDEDTLTGTGTNATLNATLGNANDNGAPIITPTISNVSTFNVSFSGSSSLAAVNELDLQDTTGTITNLNINRINDGITTARIDNIGNAVANLSVSRSGQVGQNVDFAFTSAALAGTADSTTVTVSAVNLGTLFVEERLTTFDEGFETISLVSAGPSRNVIGTFQAEDVQTLNLSGATALTLGGTVTVTGGQGAEATNFVRGLNQVAGSLTRINGSTMTGALDLTLGAELNAPLDGTSGTPVQLNVTGGSGNDIFRIAQGASIDAVTGTNVDTIDGGMGTNTLVLLGGAAQTVNAAGTAAAPVATVLNVQGLEIRTGHDAGNGVEAVTVNANAFNALATIFVRNEGNTGGAAPVSTAEAATVTLNNLTAVQANGITIAHGTTGNNGNANNNLRANLAVSTGAADVVGVTIAEGINADPRFNFNLSTNAPGLNNVNRVESINIRNNDTESNTVTLNSFADHIGTITLTRTGAAGTFLNLDGDTANLANQVGFLQRTQDGAAPIATSNETLGRVVDVGVLATQVRLVAATVDATGETSDVTVRVSSTAAAQSPVGAQTIRMGSGNDTVIFDNLNDNRAGLTISDTVVGGLGNDTLVIDGNLTLPGVLALGASEWTNVAGFETIRLVNPGANSTYSLTLTDTLIATNNNNGILAIVNDNDANNDASRTTAQALAAVGGNDAHNAGQAGAEVSVVIDARSLNANSRFSYNGEEGASRTADRIIFSDVNINGGTVINGGAIDNINDNVGIANAPAGIVGNGVIAAFGNADIIEVRNSAVVSQGDLANVSNIGALEFTNDTAVTQVSILQLNDQIVDSMVDSFQASVSRAAALGANVEVLAVRAFDNLNVVNATTGLTIEAGSLTDRSDLTVVLGRGTNTITTGAGQDNVVVLGNFTAAEKPGIVSADGTNVTNLANGVSQAALASLATQTINLGAGIDTVTFVGGVDLATVNANTNLASFEVTQFASNVSMTEAQFRALTGAGQTIRFIGGGAHTLTITENGTAGALDFSKITVAGGALVINNQSNDGNIGTVILAGGTVGGITPTTVGTTTTPAATTTAQVRITFQSANLGTAANPTTAVSYQDEDAGGALIGTATVINLANNTPRLFDASTLPAVTFDVRNMTPEIERGNLFKKVQLGTLNADTFSFAADTAPVYINAGEGNDSLTGGSGADFLVGGAGNDSLTGGNGADTVLAGAGDDTVVMNVSAGNIDSIDAGANTDTLALTGAAAGTVVVDLSVAADADQLTQINAVAEAIVQSNFENVDASLMTGAGVNVVGSSASNVLVGSAQGDVLNGAAGADTITDGVGADMILGGAGLDNITLVADAQIDSILLGDTIAGALAADADTITGFTAASGDVIALSKNDLGGAFASVVGAGFSVATDFVIIAGGVATAGTDRVIYNTTNGELTFDADGNGGGAAVLLATLVGAPTISAADFTVVA